MNISSDSSEKEAITSAVEIATAIGEAIRELGSVPSSHLYANLMGHMNIEEYEAVIGLLVSAGLVRREPSHLLVWTGSASKSNAVPDGANRQQI